MSKEQQGKTKQHSQQAKRPLPPQTAVSAPDMMLAQTGMHHPDQLAGLLPLANTPTLQRQQLVQLQRRHGNGYVQRFLAENKTAVLPVDVVQRKKADETATPVVAPPETETAVSEAETTEEVTAGPDTVESGEGGTAVSETPATASPEAAPAPESNPSPFATAATNAKGGESAVAKTAVADSSKTEDGSVAETAVAEAGATEIAAEDPAAKAPSSPQEDPAFNAAIQSVAGVAASQKSHPPAKQKSAEAQAAAVMPAGEKKGKAQQAQAGAIGSAAVAQEAAAQGGKAPGFDKATFKKAIRAKIDALMPSDPKKMEDVGESGLMDKVETTVGGQVNAGKAAAKGNIDDQAAATPNETAVSQPSPTPLKPNNPGPPPDAVSVAGAAPKNKTAGEVEAPLAADSQALDAKMRAADVTEEQLANANEPTFSAALSAKQASQAHAATAPAGYRTAETATIAKAQGTAEAEKEAGMAAMSGERSQIFSDLDGAQQGAKGKDEAKRQQIGQQINQIYEATKADVESILAEMDKEVDATFASGAQAAKSRAISDIEQKTSEYKRKRYTEGGLLTGLALRARDWAFKMPQEYYTIFREGRDQYLAEMDQVLDTVAGIVGDRLTQAKERVAQGQQEINDFVAQQPADLQEVAQEAAGDIQGKFASLEQGIDAKQNDLVNRLAQQYSDSVQAMDSELEALKSKDKGLWARAADALEATIGTILEIKDMLMGVLAQASAAIGAILKNPVKFLGNLISGIKQGFDGFVDRIGTHLETGFVSWLTGSLTGAGITLPENFDLPGILDLVMQISGVSASYLLGKVSGVLGIDIGGIYDQIMSLVEIYEAEGLAGLAKYGLERLVGESGMAALSQVAKIFTIFQTGAFGELWELIQEQLSNLKEMVFGKIKEFLVERVIKAGVTWVISLFNPAGAFIRACKMIYDVVMFFVERGSQIMSLVKAIISSVSSIAAGNLSAAASFIEQSLAKAIPVAISFLSSLLGLGNISEKVREIVTGVKTAVDKAIDKLLSSKPVQMVAGFIKKVIGRLTSFIQGEQKQPLDEGTVGNTSSLSGKINNPSMKAIREEEKQYIDGNNAISEEDAKKTAKTVQDKEPQISSIAVVDDGKSWTYDVAFRMSTKKKEATSVQMEFLAERTRQLQTRIYRLVEDLQHNHPKKFKVHESELTNIGGSCDIILSELKTGSMDFADLGRYDEMLDSEHEIKLLEIEEEIGELAEHPSKYVKAVNGKYMLKTQFQNKNFTRYKCYGKDYRSDVYAWKNRLLETTLASGGLRHPTDPNKYKYKNRWWDNTIKSEEATIEHTYMLVEHWNDVGHDQEQSKRKDFYNDRSKMEIMPRTLNSSEGAASTDRYTFEVGESFLGPSE